MKIRTTIYTQELGQFVGALKPIESKESADESIHAFSCNLEDSTYVKLEMPYNEVVILPKKVLETSVFKFEIIDE